jgi:hypothetical protein
MVDLRQFNFPFDDRRGVTEDVPLAIRRLDGKRVRLKGAIIPMDPSDQLSEFMLVSELRERMAPLLQQSVWVHMPKGKFTGYTWGQVFVDGIFHVRVEKDDGYVVAIFELTSASLDVSATGPAGN